ncbi:glycerol-3-phosphate 1-O-acyltransferase PlsY [Desulfurispira natronophila]|uniref:Glycerol-3-phosphate acyltransferase n=1 Tax=Desulfurispira natronophila TaxID=682562 RepID=A0A7W7Y4X0_9BACT|nr:glycerol-3-phosphate 1-O-acyltransferase PlsY [Desulfurispira natronophila]MBB5022160.1 glycerol-3-phosphate acyltransferase PlsY [Desulfurispira natronophila]
MEIILIAAGAYLLSSIPFGLIFVYLFQGTDVRRHGSGNIGATNVFRVGGAPAGLLTLLCDALKGYVPVLLAIAAFPGTYMYHIAVAVICLLGHSFSLFLRFRGGKGVATGLGVSLALLPLPTLAVAVLFALVLLVSGYVSLGSICAAVALPVVTLFTNVPHSYLFFAIAAAAFVVVRHRENIGRLLSGTENRLLWKDRGRGGT